MIVSKEYIESLQVSFFDRSSAPKREDMSIGRVLNGIRSEAYKPRIATARALLNAGDRKGYDKIKGGLPAVTFCGTFDVGHSAAQCTHYNELMILDIDHQEEHMMEEVKEALSRDVHVAAFWLSPSAQGYKGLVPLTYEASLLNSGASFKHKLAFEQIYIYFLSRYGIELDGSGKDISRLCYMSSDASLVAKEQCTTFEVTYDGQESTIKPGKSEREVPQVEAKDWKELCGKATCYKNHRENRNQLIKIIKQLTKRGISITPTWEEWVRVAFAIASSIHPEKGRDHFLELCRLDKDKHDELKSERLIWDAYNKTQMRSGIHTIIYLAKQKGVHVGQLRL